MVSTLAGGSGFLLAIGKPAAFQAFIPPEKVLMLVYRRLAARLAASL
jgi:hypothetical protein